MIVLVPLLVPLLAVLIAFPAALFVFSHWRLANPRTPLVVTIVIAVMAALVPNSRQWLYDRGMSGSLFDLVSNGSVFVFVFATTGAWVLIGRRRIRWLLLALVPIAFLEPLLWTFAYFLWSRGGFAP